MDKAKELKEKLAQANLRGLALDIDETLADSQDHWVEHMFKFHAPAGMTVESVSKEYKHMERVPGWGTDEALEYMGVLLHSEEFNESIPLIEDANHVVNKINEKLPILAYITARPETVIKATERWLKKHEFPEAPFIMRSADLKASQTDEVDRNKWKAEILASLYPETQGIIDDNKMLAHELHKLNYQGTLYLYGMETDEFKDYAHVVVCPTWQDVSKKIVT